MQKRAPIVIGNWKMNPNSITHAKQIFLDIKKGLGRLERQTIVGIAPPDPFLETVHKLNVREQFELWAQTVSGETGGAHTGSVSIAMLQSVGVSGVILGHSECRAAGETDEEIAQKIAVVLQKSLPITVCIGESDRDTEGAFYSFLESQITHIVSAVPKRKLSLLTIAYEPLWAIGSGTPATAGDIQEVKLYIQKCIADQCGRAALKKVSILYGGSVNAKNAASLIAESEVDGFLVGGASLRATDFVSIINSVEAYAKKTIL